MHELATPPEPPIFLSREEEELRALLRHLIVAMLLQGAPVYSPIYVGPLRRAEPVRRAVVQARSDCRPRGLHRVVLTSLSRVAAVPAPRAADVWIVWGEDPPESLAPGLQERLRSSGLVLDPREAASASLLQDSRLMDALRGAADGRARTDPVLVHAPPESLALTRAEVRLRLEALGFAPVISHESTATGFPVLAPAAGPGAAMVAQGGGDPLAIRTLAERAGRAGCLLVIVGSHEEMRALERESWMRGHPAPVRLARSWSPPGEVDGCWPPLAMLLPEVPDPGTSASPIFEAPLRTAPLYELLQLADLWRVPGFFLLFSPDRFGWIAVSDDHVTGAARAGDPDGGLDAETVSERVRRMAGWWTSRAIFLADGTPEQSLGDAIHLPISMVSLDVRRSLDEAADRPAPDGPDARLPAHRVARELLRWRLPAAAAALLADAERASEWGVEEEMLLGQLVADRDPAEAVSRLRHAAVRLAGAEGGHWLPQVDAALGALVIEVRSSRTHPAAAWAIVARWIESAGSAWVVTLRHAAILVELSARAGQISAMTTFRRRVEELSEPGDPLRELILSGRPAESA